MRIEMAITGLAAALLLGGCGSTGSIVVQPTDSTVEESNPNPVPAVEPVMEPEEPIVEPEPVVEPEPEPVVEPEPEEPVVEPEPDCADDADGDGYPDCIDECPLNPDKRSLGGEIAFTVEFLPGRAEFTEQQREGIERCLISAAEEWARLLRAPQDVTIEITVQPSDYATGTSQRQAFWYNNGTDDIFEQGVAAEIRTGVDPNDDAADAAITLPVAAWWFDPDTLSRTAPVPEGQRDIYSLFLHEMGHVLAFNWKSTLQTTWGELVDGREAEDGCYFVGESAMAIEGGPVQLFSSDCEHTRFGTVMSVWFDERLYISPLEVAMLADIGLPMRGPDDGDMYDCD